jgi:3-oxoacyl-[acyl-carrier-protein] synthase-3
MSMTATRLCDYKFLLTHQATGHIRDIGTKYGIAPERLPINIGHVGNTVSASILILLDEVKRDGLLASNDRLLLHTAESATWSYAGMSLVWG